MAALHAAKADSCVQLRTVAAQRHCPSLPMSLAKGGAVEAALRAAEKNGAYGAATRRACGAPAVLRAAFGGAHSAAARRCVPAP